MFINSAKEAVSTLFVCSLANRITQKLLHQFSENSAERWHTGPRKKPLDFGGNPDHVTLGPVWDYGYG